MVFEGLKRRREKNLAKRYGMTVEEYRRYKERMKKEKGERRRKLKLKEIAEQHKFEEFKIEQKFKEKRQQRKAGGGRGSGVMDALETLVGPASSGDIPDPLGLFGSKEQPKRKRKRKASKKTGTTIKITVNQPKKRTRKKKGTRRRRKKQEFSLGL